MVAEILILVIFFYRLQREFWRSLVIWWILAKQFLGKANWKIKLAQGKESRVEGIARAYCLTKLEILCIIIEW